MWLRNKEIFVVVLIALILALLFRIFPSPANFTPVGAFILFAAAYLRSFRASLVLMLGFILLTDALIGFYPGFWWNLLAFTVYLGMGRWIKMNPQVSRVGAGLGIAAVSFFFVSNLGVWMFSGMYAHSTQGLIQCYLLALPFGLNGLMADLGFGAAFFLGAWQWHCHRSTLSFREKLAQS